VIGEARFKMQDTNVNRRFDPLSSEEGLIYPVKEARTTVQDCYLIISLKILFAFSIPVNLPSILRDPSFSLS
jgi:hypothetical protein